MAKTKKETSPKKVPGSSKDPEFNATPAMPTLGIEQSVPKKRGRPKKK